jgi:hypothetical protein
MAAVQPEPWLWALIINNNKVIFMKYLVFFVSEPWLTS